MLESADDLASFESLVRQYSRFVFKVAYGVLRNAHDAEDVVQEVFLRVHRSSAKNVADMRAWLASVAFRLAVDRFASRITRRSKTWIRPVQLPTRSVSPSIASA